TLRYSRGGATKQRGDHAVETQGLVAFDVRGHVERSREVHDSAHAQRVRNVETATGGHAWPRTGPHREMPTGGVADDHHVPQVERILCGPRAGRIAATRELEISA